MNARKNVSEIYDAAWVAKDFEGLQPEFNIVATALDEIFDPYDVLDVGCGPGNILARMHDLGCRVRGVEGSVHCIRAAAARIRSKIVRFDLAHDSTRALLSALQIESEKGVQADLTICTELAEHLAEEHAELLVVRLALLTKADGAIFFTAAPPGQGGHDHVNEQPLSYWRELFASSGFAQDDNYTAEMKRALESLSRLSHMQRNLCVLSRK